MKKVNGLELRQMFENTLFGVTEVCKFHNFNVSVRGGLLCVVVKAYDTSDIEVIGTDTVDIISQLKDQLQKRINEYQAMIHDLGEE